jgi:predicted nucleotidyltransferase
MSEEEIKMNEEEIKIEELNLKDEEITEEDKKIMSLLEELKQTHDYEKLKLLGDYAREENNRKTIDKNNGVDILLEIWKKNDQTTSTMMMRCLSNICFENPQNVQKIFKYDGINVPNTLYENIVSTNIELRRNTCVSLVNFCHADGIFYLFKK